MAFIPYRDDNRTRTFPLFTLSLIAANVYIFLNTAFSEDFVQVINQYGYTPGGIFSEPKIIFSSIFLHANLLHLVGNMWFLWLFGDNIEDKFGKLPFLLMYLSAGVIGNFAHSLFTLLLASGPVIGASGAVAGVMGAYLIRFPKAKIRAVFFLWIYPLFFRIRSLWFIGFWLIFEFFAAVMHPGGQIAHWAHVGGFMFGAIWAYGRKDRLIKRKFVTKS